MKNPRVVSVLKSEYKIMSKYFTFLGGIVLTLGLIAVGLYFGSQAGVVQGSTLMGNDYIATSTRTVSGTSMVDGMVKTTAGSLGSVVITGAEAGSITLYNATSSTDIEKELLTTIPLSAAAGTYVFDISFPNGLYVDLNGTVPTSTITYR